MLITYMYAKPFFVGTDIMHRKNSLSGREQIRLRRLRPGQTQTIQCSIRTNFVLKNKDAFKGVYRAIRPDAIMNRIIIHEDRTSFISLISIKKSDPDD